MKGFINDYSTGCHPRILQALNDSNDVVTVGYGQDEYCQKAADKLKGLIGNEEVDVHFLAGGTQTNATFIKAALRNHQAVIAVDSGHVAVHETGAIEATGHKVLTCNNEDGKVTCQAIEEIVKGHPDEHMVQPKLVYISQTTEYGTCYTKEELADIAAVCKKHKLYLYLDGARLSSALAVDQAASLKDICEYCDAFYFGGTKSGLLYGECLVIKNDALKEDFRYIMKQSGAMMAKGRILGVQFLELFSNELYLSIGRHQNAMAMIIKEAMVKLGYKLFVDSSSNQLFFEMTQTQFDYINDEYAITLFEKHPDKVVVRLVTSYATTFDVVNKFIKYISV